MSKKKREKSGDASVSFDIEENAEELFLESLENIDKNAIKRINKIDNAVNAPKEKGQKATASQTTPTYEIDLHGCTLVAAIDHLDKFLGELLRAAKGPIAVKIITGKGIHSSDGGSVLPSEIHRHVKRLYSAQISRIEESPAEVCVGGLPIRGHFTVWFDK